MVPHCCVAVYSESLYEYMQYEISRYSADGTSFQCIVWLCLVCYVQLYVVCYVQLYESTCSTNSQDIVQIVRVFSVYSVALFSRGEIGTSLLRCGV